MLRTMAEVEFNEGIAQVIDEPEYLNVSQRNLIVLDDLMAQSCQRQTYCWSLYKRESSQNFVCCLHCPEYISGTQGDEKH